MTRKETFFAGHARGNVHHQVSRVLKTVTGSCRNAQYFRKKTPSPQKGLADGYLLGQSYI
jgi:hypothetical protein